MSRLRREVPISQHPPQAASAQGSGIPCQVPRRGPHTRGRRQDGRRKDLPGALATLCTIIAKAQGNIANLKVTDRSAAFFQFLVDIEVRDVKHVTNIMTALRASPVVSSVERSRD